MTKDLTVKLFKCTLMLLVKQTNVLGNFYWFLPLLLFMLFLLPPLNAGNPIGETQYLRRRVKRLSTPNFNEKTLELAKYVVSIRSRTPSIYFGDNHFCGGVIVSLHFVLTSAHCVMDKRKIKHRNRFLVVVAGTSNRLKYKSGSSVSLAVKGIFVPVDFMAYNTHNIALIKLARKLPKNNPHVGVINLPTAEPEPGLNYTVLGWGRMLKGGFLSTLVMSIDVELLTPEVCEQKLNTFMEEMMCAGNLNNSLTENPCAGDTGSPLILNQTVYGVVSYRIGCGSKVLPSVYTNVYMHVDWILKTMKDNGANPLRCSPTIIHYMIIPIGLLIGNKILKSFGLYLITI